MSWRDLTKSWQDTSVENCDVCGNLLIERYWSFSDGEGRQLRACRQDDEELAIWLKNKLGERTKVGDV